MIRKDHPTHDDFARAVDKIDRRFSKYGAGHHLLTNRMNYAETAGVLTPDLATILNPIDTALQDFKYDKDAMAQAVYFGQAAGTLLTFEAYGITKVVAGSIYRSLNGLPLALPDGTRVDSLADVQQAMGSRLMDMGFDGVALAGDRARAWLSDTADDIVSTIAVSPYFVTAAGIAISIYRDGIESMWQRNEREQFDEIMSATDWGSLSTDFMGGDGTQ